MDKVDLILKSSNIYKGIGNKTQSGFVAIKDDIIVDIGLLDKIDDYIGENTQVLDFDDKLIMPGIHDGHLHMFLSGCYVMTNVK